MLQKMILRNKKIEAAKARVALHEKIRDSGGLHAIKDME
jgi:hypothetical protein